MRILRHLITAALTAAMLLGGSSAASAGLVGDTYHEVTDSPVGEEAVCVIVEESSAVFGAEFGEPFATVLRQVDDRVVGCDESGSEAVKLLDRFLTEPSCEVVTRLADGFEGQGDQPEPFGSAFADVAAALRAVETAYCDGHVAIPPSGRNVRESVPPEARPVYDLATVFPCAFSAEFARQIPDQPLRDLFTATYGTLGCDDNQFLPPENRL